MKDRIAWNLSLGLALALLPLTGGCLQTVSSSPEAIAVAEPLGPESDAAIQPAAEDDVAVAEPTSETGVSDAPVTLVSTENSLPPNVKPAGPVLQVIELANSGVEESVMLAFVTNSTSTFNLRADEIIYLNDIGVPSGVVTAMIQRDELLKALPVNALPASRAPAPEPLAVQPDSAATYAAAPAPVEAPPPMEYTQEAYPPPPVEDLRPRPFTTICRPTALGWMLRVTAAAGSQRWWSSIPAGGLISTAGAGFTPIAAGIGCPIIPGAGLRSIMAAGSGIVI